jgi:hypothetical protein
MDHKLRALYGVSPTISLVVATDTLVKQVKAALVHLSMLPLDTEITALFDNAMMDAIKVGHSHFFLNILRYFNRKMDCDLLGHCLGTHIKLSLKN